MAKQRENRERGMTASQDATNKCFRSTYDFHIMEAQVHMLTADVPSVAASGDTDLERDDLTRR